MKGPSRTKYRYFSYIDCNSRVAVIHSFGLMEPSNVTSSRDMTRSPEPRSWKLYVPRDDDFDFKAGDNFVNLNSTISQQNIWDFKESGRIIFLPKHLSQPDKVFNTVGFQFSRNADKFWRLLVSEQFQRWGFLVLVLERGAPSASFPGERAAGAAAGLPMGNRTVRSPSSLPLC